LHSRFGRTGDGGAGIGLLLPDFGTTLSPFK
jgi:hypothetical protein